MGKQRERHGARERASTSKEEGHQHRGGAGPGAGWNTVARRSAGARGQATRHQDGQRTPRSPTHGAASQMGGGRSGPWRSETGKRDQGDGIAVFTQLKAYLHSEAAPAYIAALVVKLAALAEERRFQEFKAKLSEDRLGQKSDGDLKLDWKDELPQALHERYAELESYWDLTDPTHVARLGRLMSKWILENKLPQQEVENRLRVLHLAGAGAPNEGGTQGQEGTGSYAGAVRKGTRITSVRQLTEEQQRLRQLCLQPAQVLTRLRERTADEEAALMLILRQEIEVAGPPPFLVQSMTAGEIARFTDLFLGIEYPMYAHLAPAQWFGENLTKTAILLLIEVGQEAATMHKREVADFKEAMSRITLDMDTRIITVTFKGRAAAQRWTDWKMPLGGKLLQLIDYEKQREDARHTHEIVRLDHYAFTAEVRRGTLTSTDLHWIISTTMGLEVRSMEHPATDKGGINDKRWLLMVKGTGCPPKLRSIALLLTGEAEILIWHHEVHTSRPCPTCLSPNHQARYCREAPGTMESRRKRHTWRVSGDLPSSQGAWTGGYRPLEPPTTMAELMAILGGETSPAAASVSTDPDTTKEKGEDGRTSPRRKREGRAGVPVLPQEFQLHRRASDAKRGDLRGNEGGTGRPRQTDSDYGKAGEQARQAEEIVSTQQQGEEADVSMAPSDSLEETCGDNQARATEATDFDMGDDRSAAGEEQEDERRGRQREEKGQSMAGGPADTGGRRILQARGTTGTPSPTKRGDSRSVQTSSNAAGGHLVETGKQRSRSTSPKRRAVDSWAEGHAGEHRGNETAEGQEPDLQGRVRSLSPQKRVRNDYVKSEKTKAQQFMHQFLRADARATEGGNRTLAAPMEGRNQLSVPEHTGLSTEGTEEEDEFKVIKVTGPTDTGESLEVWLTALGGAVTDVAANGQCGWLAFYAALFNKKEGLMAPQKEVAEAANLLKKQVMNGMLANLDIEAQLHPRELKAEAMALGAAVTVNTDMQTVMGELAEHYAAQRKKSVKSAVPMHFWVRPAHLKAMAIHAREALYVLDVREQDQTRLQVYAYKDELLPDREMAETGTVSPMDTRLALTMLAEMTINGILPPVLVLRWQETGNHFQAVTYDDGKHAAYADHLPFMATMRNGIRSKFGATGLDAVPYDAIKNAKAAALALKTIRRSIKASKGDTTECQATSSSLTAEHTTGEQREATHRIAEGEAQREAEEAGPTPPITPVHQDTDRPAENAAEDEGRADRIDVGRGLTTQGTGGDMV